MDNDLADAVPLVYWDYFGEENTNAGVDPAISFALQLELICETTKLVVTVIVSHEQRPLCLGRLQCQGL